MTSGNSPVPTDSPPISNPPLLVLSKEIVRAKKCVGFQNIQIDIESCISDEVYGERLQADRLLQPRMSLLGKPLNYRATRRDARYRRLQSRIYNFLERPRGLAFFYHIFVFIMVFFGLVLSVFSTIEQYEKQAGDVLVYMESIVVILFSVELGLRTWSSGCRSRYQGYIGRLKFLRRPFCIIDIITIVASIVVLVLTMKSGGQVLAASALRGLRFFQILRMVRMDRRGGTWKLLGSVVFAHRQELITTLYIGFLGLIFSSFLVFLAEKDVPGTKFSNFAQALWWGVITLCTVGYGDMVPYTWQGKIIASFCSLLGISFFALPAGILGSGFALKVQQQQRQKHMIRRRQPAAMLIQSLWRCYAADEKSMSVATWKIHQVPYSPPSRASSSFRHNASFVGRFSTIRRHRQTASPSLTQNKSSENVGSSSGGNGSTRINISDDYGSAGPAETRIDMGDGDEDDSVAEPRVVLLTPRHKAAIRAIRKLKYFVARRKFREALKPYDVKDVIEQYSSGHADLLNRVKNLQYRLDQILGKQGSKNKDVYASKICLASRVVNVERQVDEVYNTLEKFFEMYMEDRKLFVALQHDQQVQSSGEYFNNSTTAASISQVTTCHGASPSGICFKPKSILVDKQLSEPNSPVTVPPTMATTKRPVQRGYSDLGNKIKKKVTLSYAACSRQQDDQEQESPFKGSITLAVPPRPQAGDRRLETTSASTSTALFRTNFEADTETGTMGAGAQDIKQVEPEDDPEDEEEANERTLLCPARPVTEIIITPSTLNTSVQEDVGVEDIYLKNFKSNRRKYKDV